MFIHCAKSYVDSVPTAIMAPVPQISKQGLTSGEYYQLDLAVIN